MKSTTLFILVKGLENIAIMLCWTALALHFGKWWIALFAYFCFSSFKINESGGSNKDGEEDE